PFYRSVAPRELHSFPTRRSSDLRVRDLALKPGKLRVVRGDCLPQAVLHRRSHRRVALLLRLDHERGIVQLVVQPAEGLVGEVDRSEEHTSELQSQSNLVCRLLLE